MTTPTNKPTENTQVRSTLPCYEVLAKDVQNFGIDSVFGLISDDTAQFAATLDMIGVRFHTARHENNAVTMAEGYAAASGRLGVAVIGRGPATANGLHGAVYASKTGSPVLIIYGDEPMYGDAPVADNTRSKLGPDYKKFNAEGVLAAAGLRVFRATSASGARAALADAVAEALLGNAVALLLPKNVQRETVEVHDDSKPSAATLISPPIEEAKSEEIEAAVVALERSRRPLIIAGYGAYRAEAREGLEQLANKIGALLITSARGKDLFRDNPWNLGLIGGFSHSAARRFIDQTDCVLVFGASLNFYSTSFGTFVPPVPLIQVDSQYGNIGRWHNADIALAGDARLVTEQLLKALPERSEDDKPFHTPEIRQILTEFDIADDFQASTTSGTVDPRSLGIALDSVLPQDRNLVCDVGNFLGILPYISVPGPGHFKTTSVFASIGMGFGSALGFAMARPGTMTVLMIGDGGFLMTLGELETAARENIPLVIVLLNDSAYGAELHFLKMQNLPATTSDFPDVDFAPIAKGFGFEAATIRSVGDLHKAAPMLENLQGPILLDCKINADIAAPFMSEIIAAERGAS